MKDKFVLLLRLFIGVVFLFSAYSKLILPGTIEVILVDNGIVSGRTEAAYMVRFLIGFEFAIGLLFFQPNFLKKIVIPTTIVFLSAFTIYLAYVGFVLGDQGNCGCFGEIVRMSPFESGIKNLFLIVLAVVLYKLVRVDDKKEILLPIILIVVSFLLVFIIEPIRDLKDFKFKKYTYFEGIGRVDLSTGEKIVAVFSLDCEHCQEAATEIGKLKSEESNFPEFYVLFFSEGGMTVQEFDDLTKTNFPYAMIDTKTFFDLIGEAPPRLYLLINGKVAEVWDKEFSKNLELLESK